MDFNSCIDLRLNWYRKPFIALRASVHTLERIAFSVKFNEPVLMVSETAMVIGDYESGRSQLFWGCYVWFH
ncbi:hypothetical protein ACS0TY_003304 [Phlomoides rotata]